MPREAEIPERSVARVELPPFPPIALRAIQLVSGDTRLRELHELVCMDPVFAGELLRVANSPVHGLNPAIKSTLQAAILLGFERLKRLVLTVGIRVYLAHLLEIPALRACWRHSLACAVIAEDLAVANFRARLKTRAYLDKDVVYTAGILHDLGRLALAVLQPQKYADFLKSTEQEPCDVLAQERKLFGIDHCQAGCSLTLEWHLPPEFIEVTSHHHDAMPSSRPDIVAAIRFSCKMSDAIGLQVVHGSNAPTYEELLEGLTQRERLHFAPDPQDYASRIASRVDAIELA
jgi:HD-like signal output (HDOD) protein